MSAFITGKFSITIIVIILTRISFFHKAFYLLFFHHRKMNLNQTDPHFDFSCFKYKNTVLTTINIIPDTIIVDGADATPDISNPTGILGTSSVMSGPLRSFLQSVALNRQLLLLVV